MTYSSALKTELCRRGEAEKDTAAAECYGLLLFCREFSEYRITMSTENPAVAQRLRALLKAVLSLDAALCRPGDGPVLHVSLERPQDRRKALEFFGHAGTRPPLRLNLPNLEDEVRARAFVRGAFLAAGSMNDPKRRYHLEFVIHAHKLADDFSALLTEFGLRPLRSKRSALHTLYFRDSGGIEDLLTLMGAPDRAMELMNLKIYRDFRNVANRRANCETANISRTVDAAAKQVALIRSLQKDGRLDALPPELKELALLRVENPELSVTELSAACGIGRSALSHRLRRLLKFAENPDPDA